MADISTPSHGKLGAIYRQRKSNFKGLGLNDVTWGTGATNAASAYYEVVIDAAAATDTFKWRKNGGSWTTGVAITGAAQTLDEGQTITFAATTGHTLTDQWTIGNLKNEGCSESGTTAQITDATKRVLNPNNPPTFTDSGGEKVLWIDFSSGTAYFTGNVTVVTVTGNNGYIVQSGLDKLGYGFDWNMTVNLDMADMTVFGDAWKTAIPGQAGGSGSFNSYYIGGETALAEIAAGADDSHKRCFLQLFTYDPDKDQTGSHFNIWAVLSSMNVNAPIGELVKEGLNFTFNGKPSYVANA